MAKVRVPYLVAMPGAGGTTRFFWQPSTALRKLGWRPLRLPDLEAAAIAKAQEINAELERWRAGAKSPAEQRPAPPVGTVERLIAEYKASAAYTGLAASTKRGYDQCLALIEAWAGASQVRALDRDLVLAFRDSMDATPSYRNAVIRVLRLVLQHAVDRPRAWGLVVNPAARPDLASTPARAVIWSHEAEAAIVAAADDAGDFSIGDAIHLGAYLAQREGDLLDLAWTKRQGSGAWRLRQSKTKKWIEVPEHPVLAARVEAMRARQRAVGLEGVTVLLSERTQRPYKADHFRHVFAAARRAARAKALREARQAKLGSADRARLLELAGELRQVQFMDLRRTAVVRLGEADCTEAQIAAVSGHDIETCRKILETYLPRTSKMAAAAIAKLVTAGERKEEG